MPTNEPVMWVQMAMSLVRAALLWVLAMGWLTLSQDQLEQTLAFGGTAFLALDFFAGRWIRARVVPTAKLEQQP